MKLVGTSMIFYCTELNLYKRNNSCVICIKTLFYSPTALHVRILGVSQKIMLLKLFIS
jgi:hypothetical protein